MNLIQKWSLITASNILDVWIYGYKWSFQKFSTHYTHAHTQLRNAFALPQDIISLMLPRILSICRRVHSAIKTQWCAYLVFVCVWAGGRVCVQIHPLGPFTPPSPLFTTSFSLIYSLSVILSSNLSYSFIHAISALLAVQGKYPFHRAREKNERTNERKRSHFKGGKTIAASAADSNYERKTCKTHTQTHTHSIR